MEDNNSKKLILFMPVYAYHWQRIYPFYRAAEAEGCEVYAVPLPFFDKDPEGGLGAPQSCEKELPDDVRQLSFDDFIKDGRKADMIYIQNPFDDRSYTSSVHPEGYSDRLKERTKKLIYVSPYDVSPISDYDERGLQTTVYFIEAPGVINSDLVYVENEKIRELYIRILSQRMGDSSVNWEERIQCNPYPDRKDYDIGLGKKRILYYISASTISEYGVAALEKMERVFEVFGAAAEDVGVLWLRDKEGIKVLERTDRALFDRYRTICEGFEKRFNDSVTCDIKNLTDNCIAYYGDPGIAASIFSRANLPVMIQDVMI